MRAGRLINGSAAALSAVRKNEELLDSMDRKMDEALAVVIPQVTPRPDQKR